MDEIEVVLRPRPLVLRVVDLELYIWRHPGWLDGGEVGTGYYGGGVFVREVTGRILASILI